MKSFKTLFVADIHMSNKLPHSRPTENGLTDRFEDQLGMLDNINSIVKEKKIDAVFILGDLFDKSLVDAVTLTHTVGAILDIPAKVYILPGNHEASSGKGGRFLVEVFDTVGGNAKVIGQEFGFLEAADVIVEEIDSRRFVFWPFAYKTVGESRAEIESVRKKMDSADVNIALVHNNILGAEHFKWICDIGLEPDKDFEGFDCVFAGHFHRSQKFGKNGMYLGAPMHHNFGDVGRDAGVWEIEFKNGEIIRKFISLDLPKFHKKKFDIDSIEGKFYIENEGIERGDYFRIEFESTKADWLKHFNFLNDFKKTLEEKEKIHASLVHKPVYYHEERLESGSELGQFSLDEAIQQYVEAPGVDTASLDKELLREYGSSVLESVRDKNGN